MTDKPNESTVPGPPIKVFKVVKYHLLGTIDPKIKKVLDENGAKEDSYLSELVTHCIADDPNADDFSEAKEIFELPVVTSRWVILSLKCGSLLPTNAFSPEVEQLFSNVVVCPSQLKDEDLKTLWAAVTYHGGKCQLQYNKKVTHLICVKPLGAKYDLALQKKHALKIVTPDWITDSVKEKSRLEEVKYHPKLLLIPENMPKVATPPPMEMEFDGQFTPHALSPASAHGSSGRLTPLGDSPKSLKTKEALARMVNSRMIASGKAVYEYPEIGPSTSMPIPMPLMLPTQAKGSRPSSPRAMLRNITNSGEQKSGAKSPKRSNKINQLVTNLNRSPKPMSPGRSPLMQQLHTYPGRPPPPTQQELGVYFGHDPIETVPEDLCLLGCVFHITDYQKYLDQQQIDTWRKVIEQHGGQMDESYSNRITHLMCDNQSSNVFHLALKDQKRVVTAHWLNDCLLRKKMMPPWQALHFPSVYGLEKPCTNQIICVTGFVDEERTWVKRMISSIGAKYTGYMTHTNSVVICKRPQGTKYVKALEWRIPVVNVQWLNDLMLGVLDALRLPVSNRYTEFSLPDDFSLETWRVSHLLEGWKAPLRIPRDAWKKFAPSQLMKQTQMEALNRKRKAEEDLHQNTQKRIRKEIPPYTALSTEGPPCVLITGILKSESEDLAQKIEDLGGYVVSDAVGQKVTHLIARNVGRTVKFLTAFSIVRHIVTPQWVIESVKENKFLDESLFTLKDERAEEEYGFNLSRSLKKAQGHQLFKDLTFYVTPSVAPDARVLKPIIENAGGKLVDRRPSIRNMAKHKTSQGEPAFIVISTPDDLHLCEDLQVRRMPIYNAELILTGIIRQTLENENYQLI